MSPAAAGLLGANAVRDRGEDGDLVAEIGGRVQRVVGADARSAGVLEGARTGGSPARTDELASVRARHAEQDRGFAADLAGRAIQVRASDAGQPPPGGVRQDVHAGRDVYVAGRDQMITAFSSGGQEVVSEPARKVFVVHGRNDAARFAIFAFLRSIGLSPIEWSQALASTGKASPYIGEVLDSALAAAQAVVVLLTPDELVSLRAEYADGTDDPEARVSVQARPNVLFEAGLALGRAPDRVVLVELGRIRHFSDMAGRHTVRLSNSVASRQELASRLRTAGCAVDLTGTDWHTTGDFTAPPPPDLTAIVPAAAGLRGASGPAGPGGPAGARGSGAAGR